MPWSENSNAHACSPESHNERSSAARSHCFEVTPLKLPDSPTIRIAEVDAWYRDDFIEFVSKMRGRDWARRVISATTIDKRSLRSNRRGWLATDSNWDRPLAAAVVQRHATGCRFFQNRCDLLIGDAVEDECLADTVCQLISVVTEVYLDFPPGFIPVVADERVARVLQLRGDHKVSKEGAQAALPVPPVTWSAEQAWVNSRV